MKRFLEGIVGLTASVASAAALGATSNPLNNGGGGSPRYFAKVLHVCAVVPQGSSGAGNMDGIMKELAGELAGCGVNIDLQPAYVSGGGKSFQEISAMLPKVCNKDAGAAWDGSSRAVAIYAGGKFASQQCNADRNYCADLNFDPGNYAYRLRQMGYIGQVRNNGVATAFIDDGHITKETVAAAITTAFAGGAPGGNSVGYGLGSYKDTYAGASVDPTVGGWTGDGCKLLRDNAADNPMKDGSRRMYAYVPRQEKYMPQPDTYIDLGKINYSIWRKANNGAGSDTNIADSGGHGGSSGTSGGGGTSNSGVTTVRTGGNSGSTSLATASSPGAAPAPVDPVGPSNDDGVRRPGASSSTTGGHNIPVATAPARDPASTGGSAPGFQLPDGRDGTRDVPTLADLYANGGKLGGLMPSRSGAGPGGGATGQGSRTRTPIEADGFAFADPVPGGSKKRPDAPARGDGLRQQTSGSSIYQPQ